VARQRHDVIVYAQFGLAAVHTLGAAKALKWPLIVNFHNCDLTTWLVFRGYARNLAILLRSPSAMFLVPSHYIAAKLVAIGAPENRTRVYYNPIPIPALSRSFKHENTPLVLLHAGRLVPMKGITYTLRAFAKVASSCDCRLRVIGAGPERDKAIAVAAELGIADRVTFLGAVDFSVVQREMAMADIFVQHSVTAEHGETEGLPVVICEAMAHRLPVVSTRHAGIPEVVKDGVTGTLVAEKDVNAMAEGLRALAMNADLRRRFGEQGRGAVEQQFSMNAAQSQLRQILNDVTSPT
jgi:glycosyltransferase involved in cell wall biosynthesis